MVPDPQVSLVPPLMSRTSGARAWCETKSDAYLTIGIHDLQHFLLNGCKVRTVNRVAAALGSGDTI